MSKRVVAFGEIMMRLSSPGFQRFTQSRSFDVCYGGAEANVVVSLAHFGLPVEFVTRLPDNDLGEACLQFVRQYGVGVDKILRGGDRLGLYFLEVGAMQRGSKVIYDRTGSAMATIEPGMFDWRQIFAGASWFHWSGITPAISRGASEVTLEAVQVAREMGLTVSCDWNYRQKLWRWGKPAGDVMSELMPYCDVIVANEEHAKILFGIELPQSLPSEGKHGGDRQFALCEALAKRFPNLRQIAVTLRRAVSASHNTIGGALWDGGQFYTGPTYDVTHIVDRVGGGDAFTAGLLYGLLAYGDDRQKTIDFAVAANCLKHSIFGDFNLATVAEVENIMRGNVSGRVSR